MSTSQSAGSTFDCSVCLKHFAEHETVLLDCGHRVCKEDLVQLVKTNRPCHVCQSPIDTLSSKFAKFAVDDELDEEYEVVDAPDEVALAPGQLAVECSGGSSKSKKKKKKSSTKRAPAVDQVESKISEEIEPLDTKSLPTFDIDPTALDDFVVKYCTYKVEKVIRIVSNLEVYFCRKLLIEPIRQYLENPDAVGRVVLETVDMSEALVFEILSVKIAPLWVVDSEVVNDDSLPEYRSRKIPLLILRYKYFSGKDMLGSVRNRTELCTSNPYVTTSEIIKQLKNDFAATEYCLASEYRDECAKASYGGFKPAFLSPPPTSSIFHIMEGFCRLDECTLVGTRPCDICHTTLYCGEAHQSEHKSLHRKECEHNRQDSVSSSQTIIERSVVSSLNPTQLPSFQLEFGNLVSGFKTSNLMQSFAVYFVSIITYNMTSNWRSIFAGALDRLSQGQESNHGYVLHTKNRAETLLFEILDIKVAPFRYIEPSLITNGINESDCVEQFPLVTVRYRHDKHKKLNGTKEYSAFIDSNYGTRVTYCETNMIDIAECLLYFKEKQLLLSEEYVEEFSNTKNVKFRPSFVVTFKGVRNRHVCKKCDCSDGQTMVLRMDKWSPIKSECGIDAVVRVSIPPEQFEQITTERKFIVRLECADMKGQYPIKIFDHHKIINISIRKKEHPYLHNQLMNILDENGSVLPDKKGEKIHCYAVKDMSTSQTTSSSSGGGRETCLNIYKNQFTVTPLIW